MNAGIRPEVEGDDSLIVHQIPALRAFARTFHRDSDSADDLVQETLTKAIRNIDKFQPGTRLKSWLFTIMRNTFNSQIRTRRREQPGLLDDASSRLSVEATQEWSARGREMRQALELLPLQQREVIVLIGVLGISYEEAAEICGCPIGTIKSRLNRGRESLLVALGEETPQTVFERKSVTSAQYFVGDG